MFNPSRLMGPATALLALVWVSCGSSNPNYCEGPDCDPQVDAAPGCLLEGPDPACPSDNPICSNHVCGGACTDDETCAERPDGRNVCLTGSGDCVACDEVDVQAVPGTAEDECPSPAAAVCDGGTHTCRPCEDHGECDSGVCDAGTCAAAADVVYMNNGPENVDSGDCTREAGCLTMHYAKSKLTATRKYIVVAPSDTAYDTRDNNSHVEFNGAEESAHIIGYDATLNRAGVGALGQVVEVRSGAVVTIEGLTISGAQGPSGDGIVCGSTLKLYRATIAENNNVGISGSNCILNVSRSMIRSNRGGGIQLSGVFKILNNFIVDNGGSLSTVSGLDLASSDTTNVLEFNTIVGNNSQSGLSDGIDCAAGTLVARNNLIVGGTGRVHSSGNCSHVNTLVAPDNAPVGSGNLAVATSALMFVSPTNFHIQAGSAAVGAALATELSPEALVDYDGDARVQGGTAVDVGADEIP